MNGSELKAHLRHTLKDYIRKIVVGSHVLDLGGQFAAPGAAILMYHSVRGDPRELGDLIAPTITHESSVFRRQMEIVATEYAPVTMDDVLQFLKGETYLPRRAVAVTFDDGFADNEEIAAPILNHFGIRAAFYATVDLIGTSKLPWYCRLRHAFLKTQKVEWSESSNGTMWSLRGTEARDAALRAAFELCAPLVAESQEKAVREIETALEIGVPAVRKPLMMGWDQLRRLQAQGHTVGSHTLSHPNAAYVANEDDLQYELVESKQRIERELGTEVTHFSYPHPALNPQWSERTVKMTASAGYRSAVTTTIGRVSANSDPLCLKRVHTSQREHHLRWNLGRALLSRRSG
jgi:peptidoglycan/xylan/chitin deacetylase (PgdA/CDA1 family)